MTQPTSACVYPPTPTSVQGLDKLINLVVDDRNEDESQDKDTDKDVERDLTKQT